MQRILWQSINVLKLYCIATENSIFLAMTIGLAGCHCEKCNAFCGNLFFCKLLWIASRFKPLAIVEVQSFGDGKGLTIRMSERVIIRKEFFNITLEERDVSYKVII